MTCRLPPFLNMKTELSKDKDGELYLPVSAIYGPNGGGKSNVLEALHSLVTKVLRPLYATSDNEDIAIKMKKL